VKLTMPRAKKSSSKTKSKSLHLGVSESDIEEIQKFIGCESKQACLECIAAHASPILSSYANETPRTKHFWSPIDKKAAWSLAKEQTYFTHTQAMKLADDLDRFEQWENAKIYEPSQYVLFARFYYFIAQIVNMTTMKGFTEALRMNISHCSTKDFDFLNMLLELVADCYAGTEPVVPRTSDEFLVACVKEIAKEAKTHVPKKIVSKAPKRIQFTISQIEKLRFEAQLLNKIDTEAKQIVAEEKKEKEAAAAANEEETNKISDQKQEETKA
jgi:hypothetical protein